MSRIRGKNTRPEMLLRRGLHARGRRFRLHRKDLPGRPDLVFPKHRAVIFVHGCFWHGHDCSLFKRPSTNPEFWTRKIERNRTNDAIAQERLGQQGWRVLTVWECALRGRGRRPLEILLDTVEAWLDGEVASSGLSGNWRD